MGKPPKQIDQAKLDQIYTKHIESCTKLLANRKSRQNSKFYTCAADIRQHEQESENKKAILKLAMELEDFKAATASALNVVTWIDRRQVEAISLVTAIIAAGDKYDLIMGMESKKSIAADIILGVALSLLPAAGLLTRFSSTAATVARSSAVNKAAQAVASKTYDEFADDFKLKIIQITKMEKSAQHVAGMLDGASKDLIDSLKDPIDKNSSIDEDTQRRVSQFEEKHKVLHKYLAEINSTLRNITNLESFIVRLLMGGSKKLADFAIQALTESGFNKELMPKAEFELLSKLILYDMLRGYSKSYVEVMTSPYFSVKGMNEAQVDAVIKNFSSVPWTDPSRPAIPDKQAFIIHWAGRTIAIDLGTGMNIGNKI